MPKKPWLLLPLLCCSPFLSAGELAPPTAAKIIRVILQGCGGGKVACGERELASELSGLGVATDPEAKAVWASSDKEVTRLAGLRRLVMCGNPDWLASGATVAITAEGGRPAIYLSLKNLGATGITLPDGIFKLFKVVK